MFHRFLQLDKLIKRKSIFVLGPRQTGKSTLIRKSFPKALYIDLLRADTLRELSVNPELVRDWVAASKDKVIILDEIQKLPEILDEVHRLIELDRNLRFILTGSSARKLKRYGTNLLGGRAKRLHLHPLIHRELEEHSEEKISFKEFLLWGGLPSILNSSDRKSDLKDYVGLYLKEEIQAEGIARSLTNFSRFLQTAAYCNGEQVIFSNVGNDAQISPRTVQDYFRVLEDTLVGTMLPGFHKSKKRKAMTSAKFYFFDRGVAHALLGRWTLQAGSPEHGRALEHFVFNEIQASIDYQESGSSLFYWRSTSQMEVDFVIEREDKSYVGIEVKSSPHIIRNHYKGLLALREDFPKMKTIVVSMESRSRKTEEGVEILTVEDFLRFLWT